MANSVAPYVYSSAQSILNIIHKGVVIFFYLYTYLVFRYQTIIIIEFLTV